MARNRLAKLTPGQRDKMLQTYLDNRQSSGQLGMKYGVHPSYVRFLAHVHRSKTIRKRSSDKGRISSTD